MNEKPINFPDEMVRAILSGAKTQTRRIIKPQPTGVPFRESYDLSSPVCPYGRPGDYLWVRETWAKPPGYICLYRADGEPTTPALKWRPSIHMPRGAARILLEITDVRVERLRDISEADARAEGIVDGGCLTCGESEPCGCANPQPIPSEGFIRLWEAIYGQGAWNADPWVWVISFRRIKP
ncbi:MAG: hypothetical protein FWH15_07705 [Betaproteobacteria bacterium]|nr:hypothetical protein [Betaproteobacteria bacterium]